MPDSSRINQLVGSGLRISSGLSGLGLKLVSEGLVLSMAGTGLGVGLAGVLMPVLRSLVPATVPRAADMDVDAGLVLFAAAVTTIATVLVSMAPALQARRLDVVTALTADCEDDCVVAADRLGYPVALKLVSPDISHKSDVGGVVLSLADGDRSAGRTT